jgi:lipopolysaccharide/colanic/teichoic acid biosynthesis glycosyltransferase
MKRALDIFILILISPALIILVPIVSLLVFINLGRPIFFIQDRPGLHGKIFRMIKFRTMKEIYNKTGNKLSDKDRLSKFGEFLRSSSLDELPEFLNVLKGDMSLVGPRPLLKRYLSRYSDIQLKRLNVKPGITGYAQVNGRNAISWDDKFELDIFYVKNMSIMLDLIILYKTIKIVLLRENINSNSAATMEEFFGEGNSLYKDNNND